MNCLFLFISFCAIVCLPVSLGQTTPDSRANETRPAEGAVRQAGVAVARVERETVDQNVTGTGEPSKVSQNGVALDDRTMYMDVEPSQMYPCQTNADCSVNNVCDKVFQLCNRREEVNQYEAVYGTCNNYTECKPLYRCYDSRCHFIGPKICAEKSECFQGRGLVPEMQYSCLTIVSAMPGQRCWMKCSEERDCHFCASDAEICNFPEDLRAKVGCCDGYCRPKKYCSVGGAMPVSSS